MVLSAKTEGRERARAGERHLARGRRCTTLLDVLGSLVSLAAAAGCSTRVPPPVGSLVTGGPAAAPARAPDAPDAAVAMIDVAAGTFARGKTNSIRRDETPRHIVHVSAFRIDTTLVTRAAFARFVNDTGYVTTAERAGLGTGAREGMEDWAWERVPHGSWRRPFRIPSPGTEPDGGPDRATSEADNAAFLRDDAPVVMVSHDDAVAYCKHYGKRLPTEAEWEYAMRAGAEKTRYPWGDDAADERGKMRLNFWQGESHVHNDRIDGFVYVSPVKAFSPNRWGIYDPVGNVWQWTADCYAEDTYARAGASVTDPLGPEGGTQRVLRGGSWWCGACTCEGNGLSYRGKADPRAAFNNNGFRCAASAPVRDH